MAITFPTALDDFPNPAGNDDLTNLNSQLTHSVQHSNANDAIEALQIKVGINSSGDTTSIDWLLKSNASTNPGHLHSLASLSSFNVASPTNGQALLYNSTSGKWENGAVTVGTVTSVALTVPSFLAVAGSPIVSSGTLAISLATQNSNLIFAGPASLGPSVPTFRSLVSADIPNISAAKITSGVLVIAQGGTNASSYAATNGVVYYNGTSLVNSSTLTYDGGKLVFGSNIEGDANGVIQVFPGLHTVASVTRRAVFVSRGMADATSPSTSRSEGLAFSVYTCNNGTQYTQTYALTGFEGNAVHGGSGSMQGAAGGICFVATDNIGSGGGGTLINGYAYVALGNFEASGTITNSYDFYSVSLPNFSANTQIRVALSLCGGAANPGAFTGGKTAAIELRGTNGTSGDGITANWDTNLYRIAAGRWRSDHTLEVKTLRATGDDGGLAATTSLTNATTTNALGGVALSQRIGTPGSVHTGYLKVFVGTTAFYVPYFS